MITWTLRDAAAVADVSPEHREDAAREELRLEVGGLAGGTHYRWPSGALQPGDEVVVRVCETTAVDAPSESHRAYPEHALESQREYVRRMCQKWGWQITET